jgi:hypothetical protein
MAAVTPLQSKKKKTLKKTFLVKVLFQVSVFTLPPLTFNAKR